MFYETGCYGRVALGQLPEYIKQKLEALPGVWLEYDRASGDAVVRLCQPASAPCLPAIASELVRMLGELTEPLQAQVPGGALYLHTEDTGQLVRLRVEAGGEVHISWAHPDYSRASRRLYSEERGELVEPHVQCLTGCITFTAASAVASRELEALADNYEGLYPEGEFVITTDEARGQVLLTMNALNLDVRLLIDVLERLSAANSLNGRIDVTSFAAATPEQHARFLFDKGIIWVQRPVLWKEESPQVATSAA